MLKNYLRLNLSLLYWVFVAPFTGQFFNISQIFRQMVFIGVRATSMVALTAFSIGVTLAMQAAHSLQQMGAEIYVPDLVMLSILREMGPVLIAVIVIGRSGSAVAAELGTMKVSEEIEALEVMAINPIQYLVVPRFLAMLIMLPALTIFGNYIGVVGGWAVCRFALNFNTAGYIMRALESADTWDLYSGIIKSVVFAWIVITIACNAGLHVDGGAEGVGQATTASVVQALARNARDQRNSHRNFLLRSMRRMTPNDEGRGMTIRSSIRMILVIRCHIVIHDMANRFPVIEVTDLVRKFGDRTVLNDISFNVHRGETLVIMGGSGCGKSTLLRHIIGSMKPTSGSVKIFGQEITTMNEREIADVRRRFGMLFQSGALLASLTVGENVALPLVQHTDNSARRD